MTRFPPLVSRLIPNLGRENDHEVVTTARAIESVLRSAGLDYHDLAAAIPTGLTQSIAIPVQPLSFGDLARACRDLDAAQLTLRERAFVAQMCRLGFNRSPSPRQAEWLSAIFARLQRRAAA